MAEGLPDIYMKFEGEGLQSNKLVGETNDSKHAGSDGWIQIKHFSFGFGFEGGGGKPGLRQGEQIAGKDDAEKIKTLNERMNRMNAEYQEQVVKKPSKWGPSGALTFDRVSFTKSADAMSYALVELCHGGQGIPKITVECCRTSGISDDTEGQKIPFLRITFSDIMFRKCTLNLATEGLPTEVIEFEYNQVEILTMWTENATGKRLPDRPMGAGWNLPDQKSVEPANTGD